MVHLGCAQQPTPSHWPRKCFTLFGGQLHRSVCLPLPFDWPGMLERGTSADCFKQNLASYQLGGLFIGGERQDKVNKERQEPTVALEMSRDRLQKETSIYTSPLSDHEK